MRTYDVVIVGGGTAGCVLAARLSEEPGRSVCLLEAGPDHGALAEGRWPADLLDPRGLRFSHDWGVGGEDGRSLGARVIGGCSAHNACVVVRGTPADYDEWGEGWSWADLEPRLDRAQRELCTGPANTETPAPFHTAFIAAAAATGLPVLDDGDSPSPPLGVSPFPANVVDGLRWNAAFAYLDPARGRPNLEVVGDALVDRVLLEGGRARGVRLAGGDDVGAGLVVLAAGAYLTPAVLARSGVGPAAELARLGVRPVADLPVGARLLDHHGTGMAWEATEDLLAACADHVARHGPAFEPHAAIRAGSAGCPPDAWDLHVLPWLDTSGAPERPFLPTAAVFHLKPRGAGRVRVTSLDPAALPLVERGLGTDGRDVTELAAAIVLVREIASTPPLAAWLGRELRPGTTELETHVRATMRGYFHPAGTCALDAVLDRRARVLGLDGLVVADASVMPTIPRANTNLTVAAIAEHVAAMI